MSARATHWVRRPRLQPFQQSVTYAPNRSPDPRLAGNRARDRGRTADRRADAARRLASGPVHRCGGEQFLEREHAHPDGHRCEFLRDHGNWRDDGHYLRRNRSVGGIDLRAGRRHDGNDATSPRPDGRWGDGMDRAARLRRNRPAVRTAQWRAGRHPSCAPLYHHARHDVGAARHRVRDDEGGKHSRSALAHAGGEGIARTVWRALSGTDAGHDRSHGGRRDLPDANSHGPAHLRVRRQCRGESVCGALIGAHSDRRVRGVRAHGRYCGLSGRELLWIGIVG